MGLYFNTAQTIKMVARLNAHFAAKSDGGRINKWRKNKNLFLNKKLDAIATSQSVIVDAQDDDDDGNINNKWLKWLKDLHAVAASTGGYVGDQLAAAIYTGLNDTNCNEIVFSVVPVAAPEVPSIDTPVKIGAPGSYSWLITIHTVQASAMKAAIKRAAAQRRRQRAATRKSKA